MGAGSADMTLGDGATTVAGGVGPIAAVASGVDVNGSGGAVSAADDCTGCYGGLSVIYGLVDVDRDGDGDGDDDLAGPAAPFGLAIANGIPAAGALNSNVDTFQFRWTSPDVGPGSATITVIQGGAAMTTIIDFSGGISEVTVDALIQTAPGSAAITEEVAGTIRSETATGPVAGVRNALAASIATFVADSAGNGIHGVTIVYSTTDGALVDRDTLTSSVAFGVTDGAVDDGASLIGGATGGTATITAVAAGASASVEVAFGGDAVACDIAVDDATVGTGGSANVTVTFYSDAAKTVPIPDYITINGTGAGNGDPTILAVNAAAGGATFRILGLTPPVGGEMTGLVLLGASGALGVTATMGGTSVNCSAAVVVGTTFVPSAGGGAFIGDVPGDGQIGLLTAAAAATPADLVAALSEAGCDVRTLAVRPDDAGWEIFVNRAPSFVNSGFPESLDAETPLFVRCA
jgi:hypothetical protein